MLAALNTMTGLLEVLSRASGGVGRLEHDDRLPGRLEPSRGACGWLPGPAQTDSPQLSGPGGRDSQEGGGSTFACSVAGSGIMTRGWTIFWIGIIWEYGSLFPKPTSLS